MKLIIATIVSFLSLHAFAAEPLAFSPYDKSIQFAGAKNNFDAQFKGQIKVTGMLLVDFERDEAYFFPDEKSIKKIPNVIAGSHPKQAEAIFIGNGKSLLNRVLSKKAVINLLGAQSFESATTVTLKNLRTQVACDTREYEAELVSITLRSKDTEFIKVGYGC